MENLTVQCMKDIGPLAYKEIFVDRNYANYLAIGIPAIAGIGVFGNLFAVWINQYRKLTGISISLLNALMIIDSGFLLSTVFIYAPRGHLSLSFTVADCAARRPAFWDSLEYAQRMYVVVHPVVDLARIMVVWFTMAYALEQYAALFHQVKMATISKDKSAGMKIIVIIFNLIIILSLIHFFKFVRKEALYGAVKHRNVCLSDVYMASAYTNYDVYVYFGLFVVVPWFLMLVIVIRISVEFGQRRRETRRRELENADSGISLVMKEARSRKIVVTISVYFLLCYAVVDTLYILSLKKSGVLHSTKSCYLVPMDRRFANLKSGRELEVVYTLFQLIYSSLKLPICYMAGKTFRRTLHKKLIHLGSSISMCCSRFVSLWNAPLSDMERLTQGRRTTHAPKPHVAIVSYDNRTFTPDRDESHRDNNNETSTRPEESNRSGYHGHGLLGTQLGKSPNRSNDNRESQSSNQRIPKTQYHGNDRSRKSERHKTRPYVLHDKNKMPVVWESHV